MKFGRSLPRNQVPEWAAYYINYKGLKKLIKAAAEAARTGAEADLTEFLFALDRSLETVDTFHNQKYAEAYRRLQVLRGRYGSTLDIVANLDDDDVEELMGALLELRAQLRNIQWFGEINRRGFVKITKKLDKKLPGVATQHRYLSTRVEVKPFAKENTITRLMAEINRWLSVLGDVHAANAADAYSRPSSRSLTLAFAKAMLNIPQAQLDKLDAAARRDDATVLSAGLADAAISDSEPAAHNFLLKLLQRSISARSRACVAVLLGQVSSLDEPDDINGRNCIHRLVIHIGRTRTALSPSRSSSFPSSLPSSSKHSGAGPASYPSPSRGAQYAQHYLTPAASSPSASRSTNLTETDILGKDDEAVKILIFLLEQLNPAQRGALQARDVCGRLPLHYAAQLGFVVVCQIIMSKMQAWGQFDVEHGIDALEWQDKEGNAPLHLSVTGGHAQTTRCLLQAENWKGHREDKAGMRRAIARSSAVLAIATKSNFTTIVQLLMTAGVDINWQDDLGETALHVAARFGHEQCAAVLLQGTPEQKADLELVEKSFGWTPLHIAAVDGHLAVAKLLIEAGADVDREDSSTWTAREHAALRGHLKIAELLLASSRCPSHSISDDHSPVRTGLLTPTSEEDERLAAVLMPQQERASLGERRSNGSWRPVEPVKRFGHRYLKNESLVLVSLGSMDMRKNLEAVKLDRIPMAEAHKTELDTALSVVISASGALGEPSMIDLPVQENISTEPIGFTTTDPSKVKILFDIVPTYSGNHKEKIGRGVALLSTVQPSIGSKRMNLQGDVCVPVVGADLEVIGSVNFNFLVITPFSHPNMEVTSRQTYWKTLTSPMVIGHRGMGMNSTVRKSLQLGENTVPSFIAAANLGAQYVEFDVQLTKDHVPVIYHDFLVSETGFDAPVHTLTLEQFLQINPNTSRHALGDAGGGGNAIASEVLRSDAEASGSGVDGARQEQQQRQQQQQQQQRRRQKSQGEGSKMLRKSNSPGPRQRSMSMGYYRTQNQNELFYDRTREDERMKHTRDFKEKGFKANSRGNFIQAPFATLEDLFRELPPSVGFDIEFKYPMLHEGEEHDMDLYAVELNSFCDTVLQKVYDHMGGGGAGAAERPIIFTSFNPDICLCLSFKQPNIPILFLTDAGGSPVGDVRASSLQEAIRFASRWNLLGIVSLAEPFVNSPRLVRVVKQSGLVCVSYGAQNNDPLLVQRQVREGIDAVVVDTVLAIRKGLTKQEKGSASSS